MKLYVIVDMQNDFITGSLANETADKVANKISNFIKKVKKDKKSVIVATRDTHYDNYLETYEGKNLPVVHCIEGTEGWQLDSRIIESLTKDKDNKKIEDNVFILDKEWFNAGEYLWDELINFIEEFFKKENGKIEEIILMGTCTDICVISNAFSLKSIFPEQDIIILKDLCAGLTKEKHEAALNVMQSCQMKVMNQEEYLNEK